MPPAHSKQHVGSGQGNTIIPTLPALSGREGCSAGTSPRPPGTTDSVFLALNLRRVSCCAVLLGHVGLCHHNKNINKGVGKKNENQKQTLQKLSCVNFAKTHFFIVFELVSFFFSKTEAPAFHISNYENTFSGHLAWHPPIAAVG